MGCRKIPHRQRINFGGYFSQHAVMLKELKGRRSFVRALVSTIQHQGRVRRDMVRWLMIAAIGGAFALLTSCATVTPDATVTPANELPMYGGVERTPRTKGSR